MPKKLAGLLLLVFASSFLEFGVSQEIDSDRDGIPDAQEQLLLEQFRPTLMVSKTDCASRPSRFTPGEVIPTPIAMDGTIYGQVFPIREKGKVEIHYYTLWDQDCGRMKHPLDVEHVSVLIAVEPGTEPKGLYWYAGAHERTSCDISSAARALTIDAQDRGPRVWSYAGKHALYLREIMCGKGCDADSCKDSVELSASSPVINLGEFNAPANGALWITSPQWPFKDKMATDFSTEIIAKVDAAPEESVVTVRGSSIVRGTIQGSDLVLDGAATGAQDTGTALNTANGHTSSSLGKATKATGRALTRVWKGVFRK